MEDDAGASLNAYASNGRACEANRDVNRNGLAYARHVLTICSVFGDGIDSARLMGSVATAATSGSRSPVRTCPSEPRTTRG